jgi:hypothetical protein
MKVVNVPVVVVDKDDVPVGRLDSLVRHFDQFFCFTGTLASGD